MIQVVLIDHNDSFTYNVVEALRKINNNELTVILYKDLVVSELQKFDKIILSPGPCVPTDYPKTFDVIRSYYKTKSILGICLGHQSICSFFGAELYQLNDVIHGIDKTITIKSHTSIFKNIKTTTSVGLYHSWTVRAANLPLKLRALAFSDDNLLMSVEHLKYQVYGIQFHPESFLTIDGEKMLKNFIEL